MKWSPKSFGVKLWLYFVLFSAMILGALWLLQTVFLQSFYDGMVMRNVEKAAKQIAAGRESADFDSLVDNLANSRSLLIFLTDWQKNILYNADEHSGVYRENRNWHNSDSGKNNPYHAGDEPLNWQVGAYRNLPQDYDAFLQRLSDSEDGIVAYQLGDGSAYVYGMILSPSVDGKETVLYISTALGAVNATVGILSMQLAWVTIAALIVGFVIAFLLSQRFARPVSSLSRQAKRMAAGDFQGSYEKGFCSELDELSDTLRLTADSLAKAESFRREFLANVSHDLRTPLTMIRGYSEMVRDVSWEEEEKREKDLSIIIRETDRLTNLVNEILEYSALQSEPRAMELENVAISAAAQDVIRQFAPLCEHDGLIIESEIEPGLWVYGNEKQLARVLYNLIDNALSHSGDNRRIQVALKRRDAVVRIEIRDFGAGISQDQLPHIWDRYFSLKQKKRNEKGSGLGLAISREILSAHKAILGVESTEGQGSLFWFELNAISEDMAL